ncbi:PREDICTED: podocalyxin [Nipponia nippon]|uniref:podocalyxin n=1 Tax=Nipponia nippon TaxID=128390 RepID=UPI0005113B50|nr:PREDICTED: podocalyxin [Nipponia nippon]
MAALCRYVVGPAMVVHVVLKSVKFAPCVSSQDATKTTPASPGENGQTITTTHTGKIKATTSESNPGNPASTSAMSSTTVQGSTPINKLGSTSPTPVTSPSAAQGTTPTSNLGNSASISAMSPTTVQGSTPTSKLGNPSPTSMTLPHLSQQVSSSTSSRASTATPAATSSTAQQKTSSLASLGSLVAATHASSHPTTPGGSGTAVTSSRSVETQRGQPSDQLTSTAASMGVSTSSCTPGHKNYGVSSPTSVTKQLHSSPSSPVQGLTSSTPGSIDAFVTPSGVSISLTTSKAVGEEHPGSTKKGSEAATTPTPGADQRSHDLGSVSTTPTSADQSPASAQPSAPALGNKTASSSPGHQHPNDSFQNQIICKEEEQSDWPIMHLKEAKTCAEWKTASVNISFFESFCSTGQRAFNASRETCTVMLNSRELRSQHWAMRAVVHFPLDPEKVFKELKEKKDKLEELGITNITYDKMEKEMIINDEFSTPLIITIVTLAGSLLLIAAIYGCCHQRFSQKKDQHIHPDVPGFDDGHVALIFNQRLTEELQTMENGYHDNPTLEVMETSSEMQEKKVNLNGELGDSWIVPLDTLMKEDLEEEEDTHL